MFVDEATIEVKGGEGGDGSVAFRREKYMPHGGPSGGDGGDGGHVILKVHPHVKTLLDFSRHRHYKGERGRHGEGGRRKGNDGASVTLNVPIGTQVFDAATGALLTDLLVPGQTFIAAQGGIGGRGNTRFVSSARQAPRFSEKGSHGEERTLKLTLKVLADVALIGLPNAGKSTLIAAISAARPKIADYPFTTLVPNLGAVRLDTETQFIVADIPGLIRGAHRGAGLGHQFLKHIERAPVFIHLLDATQAQGEHGGTMLWRNFMSLNRELKLWKDELLERPQLVAINKLDAISADEAALQEITHLKQRLQARGCEVFEISAATSEGLQPLLWRVWELVKEARESLEHEEVPPPVEVTRVSVDKPFVIKEIARYADGMSEWEVEGGSLQRLVERFDMENYEAVLHLHRLLERQGVLNQLKETGVRHGDLVHVGKVAFAFEE
ncbi:MAG: GTPase ObgE [Abitibacteriaceae bacterium]|nr:GTPase ObgE [Abditibacteriaceae bacterium]